VVVVMLGICRDRATSRAVDEEAGTCRRWVKDAGTATGETGISVGRWNALRDFQSSITPNTR
jgi:hypothetical protein